jgi:hypothetical protein
MSGHDNIVVLGIGKELQAGLMQLKANDHGQRGTNKARA